jgi:hypothetical protein
MGRELRDGVNRRFGNGEWPPYRMLSVSQPRAASMDGLPCVRLLRGLVNGLAAEANNPFSHNHLL